MDGRRFRVASPQIISETLEGEAVAINLDTGTYYSFDPAGTMIWDAASGGDPVAQTVNRIVARFDGDADEIRDSVLAFLAELEAEGLLAADDSDALPPHAARPEIPGAPSRRPQFNPPTLNRYTDIQDLLLLDPIHEVEESGWPQAKRPAGGKDGPQ